ncbi:MAG: hypothetical protein KatS3mg110_2744 [Pirellulaceae bacterium]|nr:MAG: hypothetical protein KatS3mg110_2744 [Pirellulaceae bacterium]
MGQTAKIGGTFRAFGANFGTFLARAPVSREKEGVYQTGEDRLFKVVKRYWWQVGHPV